MAVQQSRGDHVEIDFDKVVRENEAAVCLSICEEEVWIPNSLISERVSTPQRKYVSIPIWFATKKGLV